MINYNGTELRNLEQQVLKNKEDIARHYEIDRALANLGIKIVGQVNSSADLPDPLTYLGAYGDAYAVGNKAQVEAGTATYSYYVFSRPDYNAGIEDNHWLDVGKISIAGPQGIQGEMGPRGPQGEANRWFAVYNAPSTYLGQKENDLALVYATQPNSSVSVGDVFRFKGGKWEKITNIIGPQGVQGIQGERGPQGSTGQRGPQGPRGDVGGLVNIAGVLTAANQLPDPAALNNVTVAYLVGSNKDLYIQVGLTPATSVWENMGPLNVATLVTTNGAYQNTWETNTKVDKLAFGSTQVLYCNDPNTPGYPVAADTNGSGIPNIPYSIPVYYNPNQPQTIEPPVCLATGTPKENFHAATKAYVDAKVASGGGGSSGGSTLYKNQIQWVYTNSAGQRRQYMVYLNTKDNLQNFGFGSLTTLAYYILSSEGSSTTATIATSDGDLGVCQFGTSADSYSLLIKLMTSSGIKEEIINNNTSIEFVNITSTKL